jgi:hypothetical protein
MDQKRGITFSGEYIKHLCITSIAVNNNYLVAAYYDEDFDECELQIYNASTLKSIGFISNEHTKYIHSVRIHLDRLYYWNINEAKVYVTDIFFKSRILTIGTDILERIPRCISFGNNNDNEMYVLDKYSIIVFDSKTGECLRCISSDVNIDHIAIMQVDNDYIYFLVLLPKSKTICVQHKNTGQHVKVINCDSDMASHPEDKMVIVGDNIIVTDIMNKKIFIIDKYDGSKIYQVTDDLRILEPLVVNNKKLYLSCYHDLHTYDLHL